MFTGIMLAVCTEESACLKCDIVSLWKHSQSMKGHSSSGKLSTTRPTTKRHIPNDSIFNSTAVRT